MTEKFVDVLQLCAQFKENIESIVEKNPSLQAKAQEAITPHMEEVQGLMEDILNDSMEAMFDDPAALMNDESFQQKNTRLLELFATVAPKILNEDQIWSALPDQLKNNKNAADLLQAKDAPTMAKTCLKQPGK